MHSSSFAPSAISLCQNQSHDPKLPTQGWALVLQASHIPLHVHLWLSPTRQREHSPQASASVPALHKEPSRRCRTLQRPLRLDFSLVTASLINCHQTCMPGKQSNCHSVTPAYHFVHLKMRNTSMERLESAVRRVFNNCYYREQVETACDMLK